MTLKEFMKKKINDEELLSRVEHAKSNAELMEIAKEIGSGALLDEQLEQINGGMGEGVGNGYVFFCGNCNIEDMYLDYGKAKSWVENHKSEHPNHDCGMFVI